MPIDDVSAAKNKSVKNIVATIRPPGIWPNATGRLTKASPPPPAGSIPAMNTIGNIARPANKATVVSAITISVADSGRFVFFSMYEP